MQSQVSRISPVLVEVKVEIPWDDVRRDLDEKFRKVGRSARIKGFRPGKVPPKVVRQVLGRQVRGEVTAQLIEKGLLHAVSEHDLQVVAEPKFDLPTLKDGKPLSFSAQMEVRPEIARVDTSNLALTRDRTEVPNEAVDDEVERLRRQHGELQAPEPARPAREGDQVVIDYAVELDGEINEALGATGRTVELGNNQLIKEFEEGLIGLSPGDEKEIVVSFGDDHDQEDLRSKTAKFQVSVKELREMILPEVDDEFAKDVGDYETLLELRLDVRKRLEGLANQRAEADLKAKLVDKLIETNDVPVPPSMVQQEEGRMLQEFVTLLQLTGQRPDLGENFQQDMKDRAERRVKAAILLGALAREQGIEIGEKEVADKLTALAEQTGKHVAKLRAEYQGEQQQALENQLLEEKLMDYLMSQATIREADPEDDPTGDDAKDTQDDAESQTDE